MDKIMDFTPENKCNDDLPFLDSPSNEEDFTPTCDELRILARHYFDTMVKYSLNYSFYGRRESESMVWSAYCRLKQIEKILGVDALDEIWYEVAKEHEESIKEFLDSPGEGASSNEESVRNDS